MPRRISRGTALGLAAAAVLAAGATAAAIATLTSQKLTITSKALTHATCTTATVSDASWTDEQNTTTTHSAAASLSISPKSGKRAYAWVKFSLAPCSFPANSVVDSATLTVNLTTALTGRTISVSPASAAWAQGTITWANQPAAGAATGTFSGTGTGNKTIDVSSDLDGWVDGSATNNGWEIADLGATATVTGAISGAPTLSISYAY